MIYLLSIEDKSGDLVDQEWYHASCAPADADRYPGGAETDYDVHCAGCGELLWKGLQSEV